MKKIIFGIFAHPDDEAFGPSGTLLKLTRQGVDVHLICITRGDAGTNTAGHTDLGVVREKEWRHAGELLGAKSLRQLGYGDGTLSNHVYHRVAQDIETRIKEILAKYSEPLNIDFMSFDTTGLTGHLDHIAASMITSYVFVRLRNDSPPTQQFEKIWHFCWPKGFLDNDASFVYAPAGRSDAEVDEIIDVSELFDEKLAVMRAHESQQADADWTIARAGEGLKRELFRHIRPY